jgi:hypothetical protein
MNEKGQRSQKFLQVMHFLKKLESLNFQKRINKNAMMCLNKYLVVLSRDTSLNCKEYKSKAISKNQLWMNYLTNLI